MTDPIPDVSSPPLVRCPSCGDIRPYSLDNPYRPFCSKGCKAIDLGAWASEQYRVAPPPAELDGIDDDLLSGPPPGDER